jgi:hypothetical protein
MLRTVKEYLRQVIVQRWLIIPIVAGVGLAIADQLVERFAVPAWGWILAFALVLSVAQFRAFLMVRHESNRSLKQYLQVLIVQWWNVVFGVVLAGLSVANFVTDSLSMPDWGWILIVTAGLSVAQFGTYHAKQRSPSFVFTVGELNWRFESPSRLYVEVDITATPQMLVDNVELLVPGRTIPSDWGPEKIRGNLGRSAYFDIPDWVGAGVHKVQLLAHAEGHTAKSQLFEISFPTRQ